MLKLTNLRSDSTELSNEQQTIVNGGLYEPLRAPGGYSYDPPLVKPLSSSLSRPLDSYSSLNLKRDLGGYSVFSTFR